MPFDGNKLAYYLIAIVSFAVSFNIFKIFAKQIKSKKFVFDNEDEDQRDNQDLHHSTGYV